MAQAPPKTRNLGRLTEIARSPSGTARYFFERHKLTDLLPGRRDGTAIARRHPSERGRHLAEPLDELGPTFVKFGQLSRCARMCFRPTSSPSSAASRTTSALRVRGGRAASVTEDSASRSSASSSSFDPEPIAAASIGQVHRAVCPTDTRSQSGQRPGAPEQIEADPSDCSTSRADRQGARAGARLRRRGEVVDELRAGIRQELDYGSRPQSPRRCTGTSPATPHVRVPRVYWTYTRAGVLTLRVHRPAPNSPTCTNRLHDGGAEAPPEVIPRRG